MSVDVTHYLGIGVKLDYDTYKDLEYNDGGDLDFCIDKDFPEISHWWSIRKNSPIKTNVRWISDGMSGQYIYLMYVITETAEEDFYNYDSAIQIDLKVSVGDALESINVNIDAAEKEVKEYYDKLKIKEPWPGAKLISLFHCS